MTDFLGRDQSPLTEEQWKTFDEVVVQIARRSLVGRRMLNVYGPIGPDQQVVPNDRYQHPTEGEVNFTGETDDAEIRPSGRRYMALPILHKDFTIHWRDLVEAQRSGMPMDTGPVASAAAYCARLEDELIFNGRPDLGYDGLRNVQGRMSVGQNDWNQMGNALRDVTAAVEQLSTNGFVGPYAVAVSPRMLVAMNRMFENTGVLEIDQIRKLATAGVYVTPVLTDPSVVVIATGPENLDLVVGVDMVTAYLEASEMNHHFRVLETLVLRIKRPEAICTIEGSSIELEHGAGQPEHVTEAVR